MRAMASGEVQFGRGSATEVVSAHIAGFRAENSRRIDQQVRLQFRDASNSREAIRISRAGRWQSAGLGPGRIFITRIALKSWGLEPRKDDDDPSGRQFA